LFQESFSILKHYRPFCYIAHTPEAVTHESRTRKGRKVVGPSSSRIGIALSLGLIANGMGAGVLRAQPAATTVAPTASPNELFERGEKALDNKDYGSALRLYQEAAKAGHIHAQAMIGAMYESGFGVTQDYAQAANWYRLAAEQGDPGGQELLGRFYLLGKGVAKDYARGLTLLRKASDQGAKDAPGMIASIYLMGLGVPTDQAQAVYWLRLGAERGSADAKEALKTLQAAGADGDGGKLISLRCKGSESTARVTVDPERQHVTLNFSGRGLRPFGGAPPEYQDGRVWSGTEYIGILFGGESPDGAVTFQYTERVSVQPNLIEFVRERRSQKSKKQFDDLRGTIDRRSGEMHLNNGTYECAAVPSTARF
jgi:hypothetical protein